MSSIGSVVINGLNGNKTKQTGEISDQTSQYGLFVVQASCNSKKKTFECDTVRGMSKAINKDIILTSVFQWSSNSASGLIDVTS